MTFPVKGLSPRSVQSQFGAQRDAGRRSHEGIDIFAPRGTPVVAAIDGWVGSSTANGLGGNVIWVWSPVGGLRTYYAHLDRYDPRVREGMPISRGDTAETSGIGISNRGSSERCWRKARGP